MFSKTARKVVGWISIVAAGAWLALSCGLFFSVTAVVTLRGEVAGQFAQIKTTLADWRRADFLGVATPTINALESSLTATETSVLNGLSLVQVGLLIFPVLLAFSQVLPLYMGLQLLRT